MHIQNTYILSVQPRPLLKIKGYPGDHLGHFQAAMQAYCPRYSEFLRAAELDFFLMYRTISWIIYIFCEYHVLVKEWIEFWAVCVTEQINVPAMTLQKDGGVHDRDNNSENETIFLAQYNSVCHYISTSLGVYFPLLLPLLYLPLSLLWRLGLWHLCDHNALERVGSSHLKNWRTIWCSIHVFCWKRVYNPWRWSLLYPFQTYFSSWPTWFGLFVWLGWILLGDFFVGWFG